MDRILTVTATSDLAKELAEMMRNGTIDKLDGPEALEFFAREIVAASTERPEDTVSSGAPMTCF